MVHNEVVAASLKAAAIPETLDLVASVPIWIIFNYLTRSGRLLEARRLAVMFTDGRSKTMGDHRGMSHNTDIGA